MKQSTKTKNGKIIEASGYNHIYRNDTDFYIGFPDGHAEAIQYSGKKPLPTWADVERTFIHPELELSSLPDTVVPLLAPGEKIIKHIIDRFDGQYGMMKNIHIVYGGIILTNMNRAITYGEDRTEKVFEHVKDILYPRGCGLCVLYDNGTIREVEYVKQDIAHRSYDDIRIIESWTGITKISASSYYFLALKDDGTVLSNNFSDEVVSWHDVMDIYCGKTFSIGLCKDGSTVKTGHNLPDLSFREMIEDENKQVILDPSSVHFNTMDHVLPVFGGTIGWNDDGTIVHAHLQKSDPDMFTTNMKIKRIVQSDQFEDLFYVVDEKGNTYELLSYKYHEIRFIPELKNVIRSIRLLVLLEDGCVLERPYAFSGNPQYKLLYQNIIDIGYGDDYQYRHYEDQHVDIIVTRNSSKYPYSSLQNVKKVYPTPSHVIFLFHNGHVTYMGKNTNRCCKNLDQYVNIADIVAHDDTTVLTTSDGTTIRIP